MESSQADTLSNILAEMATKSDLAELRSEVKAELASMRADLATMKADLTWRMIAVVGFVGTVITILNAFLD